MGIRKFKPTTPGRRGSSVADFAATNFSRSRCFSVNVMSTLAAISLR